MEVHGTHITVAAQKQLRGIQSSSDGRKTSSRFKSPLKAFVVLSLRLTVMSIRQMWGPVMNSCYALLTAVRGEVSAL